MSDESKESKPVQLARDAFDIRQRYAGRNRLTLLNNPATVFKTNKDGIQYPVLGAVMADPVDSQKDPIIPVPRPGILDMLNMPPWLKVLLVAVGAIAVAIAGAAEMGGVALPAIVVSIAKVIAALAGVMGIAQSSGSHAAEVKK